jgi:hypothetical protein
MKKLFTAAQFIVYENRNEVNLFNYGGLTRRQEGAYDGW